MMTNAEFARWCEVVAPRRHGNARFNAKAIGRLLHLDPDTVIALQRGTTRKGNPAPVPRTVELACILIENGRDRASTWLPFDVRRDLDSVQPKSLSSTP